MKSTKPKKPIKTVKAEAKAVMTKAEVKKLRRQIFESMNGCDCPLDVGRGDRCALSAVRCNGRLGVIQRRLKEHGLPLFPSST